MFRGYVAFWYNKDEMLPAKTDVGLCRKLSTKNWCFWTVVLEKTLESPLDCKEIERIHSEGDQSWVFVGRTDAEAETPILWPLHTKSWLIGKDPDAGRDWGQEEKGTTEDEMAGWHHWLDGCEFGWTPGVGDGQGGLACCDSWGRKESDTTEGLNWLNWTENWCSEQRFVLFKCATQRGEKVSFVSQIWLKAYQIFACWKSFPLMYTIVDSSPAGFGHRKHKCPFDGVEVRMSVCIRACMCFTSQIVTQYWGLDDLGMPVLCKSLFFKKM